MSEARKIGEILGHIIRFRDACPDVAEQFIDVKYSELVSDPLAVVRRIYARLLAVQLLKRRRRSPLIATVQCISPFPFLCLRSFLSSHKFALFSSFALNAELPG